MKKLIYTLIGLTVCLYAHAQSFTFFEEDGLKGVKNAEGKVIIKPKFNNIEQNSKNYFLVSKLQKNKQTDWWIYDSKGKEISDVRYFAGGSFSKGFFQANISKFNDGKLAVYNEDLQVLAKDLFLGQMYFRGNYAVVQDFLRNMMLKGSGKIYDKQWNVFLSYDNTASLFYSTPDYLTKELVKLKVNGKWGLYRSDLTEILPLEYDDIRKSDDYFFHNQEVFAIIKNGKTGFYNANTGVLVPANYYSFEKFDGKSYLGRYPHGIDILTKDGIKGQLNQYDSVTVAADIKNMFYVRKNQKTGLVNNQLQEIVPAVYDSLAYKTANSSKDSILVLTFNRTTGLCGLYGSQQKELVAPVYEEIKYLNDSIYLIRKNKQWGVLMNGKVGIEPSYDDIRYYCNGVGDKGSWVRIARNNKLGLLNLDTNESTGCMFDKLELLNYMDKDLGSVYLAKDTGKMTFLYANHLKSFKIKFDDCMLVDQEVRQGIVRLKDSTRMYYYNLAMDKLSVPIKRFCTPFDNGYARVGTALGFFYINTIFIPMHQDIVYDPRYNYIMLWVGKAFASDYKVSSYHPIEIEVTEISPYGETSKYSRHKITGGTSQAVTNWTPQDIDDEGFVIIKLEKHKKYTIYGSLKPMYSYQNESTWKLNVTDATFATANKFLQELGQ